MLSMCSFGRLLQVSRPCDAFGILEMKNGEKRR